MDVTLYYLTTTALHLADYTITEAGLGLTLALKIPSILKLQTCLHHQRCGCDRSNFLRALKDERWSDQGC